METSTQKKIPQFRTMSLDELRDVRSDVFGTKLAGLDLDAKQWVLAYVDALIAVAEHGGDETHPG